MWWAFKWTLTKAGCKCVVVRLTLCMHVHSSWNDTEKNSMATSCMTKDDTHKSRMPQTVAQKRRGKRSWWALHPSLRFEQKVWDDFVGWLEVVLGAVLMGYALTAYGRHLFGAGKSLSHFRHLVVFAQRGFSGLRGHLQLGGQVINRWEELEPVEHRGPVTVSLVRAMALLAVSWNFVLPLWFSSWRWALLFTNFKAQTGP